MKILIAVHHFPPTFTGGAEWRAYRTAIEMQARGHAVRVICVEKIDQPVQGNILSKDDLFENIWVRRLYYNIHAAPDPFLYSYDNPWIGEAVDHLLHEFQPDIVHLIGGYLLSRSLFSVVERHNIPLVVSLTDFWYLCPRLHFLQSNQQISRLPIDPFRCARCLGEDSRRWRIPGAFLPRVMNCVWRFRKREADKIQTRYQTLIDTLNKADVIVSPSEFLRSTYIEAGIDPDRIVFSRQGRYPVQDLEQKTELSFGTRPLQIGYIGSILPHKGIHVLVDAVRSLPDAPLQLRIFGDHHNSEGYTSYLVKRIAGDRRIKLEGVFARPDLGKVLNKLDVLVVPSLWYENSPNSILEAFAYKTPVIATDLGGMTELIEHGINGFLFPLRDPGELAKQLSRIIAEPALLKDLQKGIGPVRSVSSEMDHLEQIYQSVQAQVLTCSYC
jgi:glycosyltransferase involved in cell wall biosynthesis